MLDLQILCRRVVAFLFVITIFYWLFIFDPFFWRSHDDSEASTKITSYSISLLSKAFLPSNAESECLIKISSIHKHPP